MKRDIERTKLFSREGWLVRTAKGQERWKVAERFERRAQGGLVENGRWLSKGENCQESGSWTSFLHTRSGIEREGTIF